MRRTSPLPEERLNVRFWLAADMSIPEPPSLSICESRGQLRTNPPGLRILIPNQVMPPPSAALFAPEIVLSHIAMSPEPGTVPLEPPPEVKLQLPLVFNAMVLSN